jgi:hypothetical protein
MKVWLKGWRLSRLSREHCLKNKIPAKPQIVAQLKSFFDRGEWQSQRRWIKTVQERQSFITANILTILDHCDIRDEELLGQMAAARTWLPRYQEGHRVYHWEMRKGKPRIPGAPIANATGWIGLSADADCSVVQNLACGRQDDVVPICDDLSFYRANCNNFIVPPYQDFNGLGRGTFLTWWPAKPTAEKVLESIDIGVTANILWFLGVRQQQQTPGYSESVALLRFLLQDQKIWQNSMRLSYYYPKSVLLLFLISRAAIWGKIDEITDIKDVILARARTITAHSDFEYVLLAAIENFWGNTKQRDQLLEKINYKKPELSAFYIFPLLAPVALRWPAVLPFARAQILQADFVSEALLWSILLWLRSGKIA